MKTRCLLFSVFVFAAIPTASCLGMKAKELAKKKNLFISTSCVLHLKNRSGQNIDIQFTEQSGDEKRIVKKRLEAKSPKNFTYSICAYIAEGLKIVLETKQQFELTDEDKKQPLQKNERGTFELPYSLPFELKTGLNEYKIVEGNSEEPFLLLRSKPDEEDEVVAPKNKDEKIKPNQN